jgi:hypothetical protein
MNNTPLVIYMLVRSNFSYPHWWKSQPTIWTMIYQKIIFEPYIVAFNKMWRQWHDIATLTTSKPLLKFWEKFFCNIMIPFTKLKLIFLKPNNQSSKSLQTFSYSFSPSCAKDKKASTNVLCISTFSSIHHKLQGLMNPLITYVWILHFQASTFFTSFFRSSIWLQDFMFVYKMSSCTFLLKHSWSSTSNINFLVSFPCNKWSLLARQKSCNYHFQPSFLHHLLVDLLHCHLLHHYHFNYWCFSSLLLICPLNTHRPIYLLAFHQLHHNPSCHT